MTRWMMALGLCCAATAAAGGGVTREDRRAVVESAARQLETQYVFPEKGKEMAKALRLGLRRGDYEALADGKAFAERLSKELQRISGDGHLNVEYSEKALPEDSGTANAEFDAQERERYYGARLNFGFQRVERLDGNIGFLDLRVFAPVDMGGATAVAAMQFLAHTEALIIDLRQNGGGDGDMANLLMSYLFDRGTRRISGFYSRPKDELTQGWTHPYVPGLRYGERKPVYVLISRKTFSAAEAFAYDLQALRRVTVIGEPSGGGAHPFEYSRLHPHFVLWLVTGRSLNPITRSNWQGTGVKPDVEVPAAQALERALGLAREAVAH